MAVRSLICNILPPRHPLKPPVAAWSILEQDYLAQTHALDGSARPSSATSCGSQRSSAASHSGESKSTSSTSGSLSLVLLGPPSGESVRDSRSPELHSVSTTIRSEVLSADLLLTVATFEMR